MKIQRTRAKINSSKLYLDILELLIKYRKPILEVYVNLIYISLRLSIERTRYKLRHDVI